MNTEILVSVIIPSYNRAHFLEGAVKNIIEQDILCIEIIIVDDGSCDNTPVVCEKLAEEYTPQIKYHYQKNSGAGVARANGLHLACGKYIAFFDSDDYWLEGHLSTQINILEEHRQLDAVYSNAVRKELSTERVLDPSVFHTNEAPKRFMELNTYKVADVNVIDDHEIIKCHIEYGLYAGFQTTTFRRSVFSLANIPENRVGQDRFFFLNFLFEGLKIGYLTEPTVWIYEHEQNTSSTEYINHSSDKKIKNALTIANGYLDYKHSRITKDIKKTLIEKAASELFWNVGYNIYLNQGDKRKAIITFMQAIRIWPWNLAFWKTLVSTLIKM